VRFVVIALLAISAGCARHTESAHDQAARLRGSIERYRAEYLKAIESENRLIPETLAWLSGDAVFATRSRATADARVFMDRWARVYFAPRYMHEQLRFDRYTSPEVRRVQEQILGHLKRRYFELHDYQRYAQHASQSEMHRTAAGRLPRQLEEFRSRLQSRRPAGDEIAPLLALLPQ
jgi:hypothetical protein